MDLTCLSAPGDGCDPCMLVTVSKGKTTQAQYVFNVPEGLSRLALEHRARPGASLKAVMVMGTTPGHMGGMGGLLLRLKQDGHGHLTLMGPPGVSDELCQLGAFVKWRHPTVMIKHVQPPTPTPTSTSNPLQTPSHPTSLTPTPTSTAAIQSPTPGPSGDSPSQPPDGCNMTVELERVPAAQCYDDECVQVAALWVGGGEGGEMGVHGQLPTWLQALVDGQVGKGRGKGAQAKQVTSDSSTSSESSSNSSSSSSSRSSGTNSNSTSSISSDSSDDKVGHDQPKAMDDECDGRGGGDEDKGGGDDKDKNDGVSSGDGGGGGGGVAPLNPAVSGNKSSSSSEDAGSSSSTSAESDDSSDSESDSGHNQQSIKGGVTDASTHHDAFSALDELFLSATVHGRGVSHGLHRPAIKGRLHTNTSTSSLTRRLHGANHTSLKPHIKYHTKQAALSVLRQAVTDQATVSTDTTTSAQGLPTGPTTQPSTSAKRGRDASAVFGAAGAKPTPGVPQLVGYLLHVRPPVDVLVLVLCVSTLDTLDATISHPVVQALTQHATLRDMLCCVAHLTRPHLMVSPGYRERINKLPGRQMLVGSYAGEGKGQAHVQGKDTVAGTAASAPVQPLLHGLGFHASARVTARLHLLQPEVFPLPAQLRHLTPPLGLPSPTATQPSSGDDSPANAAADTHEHQNLTPTPTPTPTHNPIATEISTHTTTQQRVDDADMHTNPIAVRTAVADTSQADAATVRKDPGPSATDNQLNQLNNPPSSVSTVVPAVPAAGISSSNLITTQDKVFPLHLLWRVQCSAIVGTAASAQGALTVTAEQRSVMIPADAFQQLDVHSVWTKALSSTAGAHALVKEARTVMQSAVQTCIKHQRTLPRLQPPPPQLPQPPHPHPHLPTPAPPQYTAPPQTGHHRTPILWHPPQGTSAWHPYTHPPVPAPQPSRHTPVVHHPSQPNTYTHHSYTVSTHPPHHPQPPPPYTLPPHHHWHQHSHHQPPHPGAPQPIHQHHHHHNSPYFYNHPPPQPSQPPSAWAQGHPSQQSQLTHPTHHQPPYPGLPTHLPHRAPITLAPPQAPAFAPGPTSPRPPISLAPSPTPPPYPPPIHLSSQSRPPITLRSSSPSFPAPALKPTPPTEPHPNTNNIPSPSPSTTTTTTEPPAKRSRTPIPAPTLIPTPIPIPIQVSVSASVEDITSLALSGIQANTDTTPAQDTTRSNNQTAAQRLKDFMLKKKGQSTPGATTPTRTPTLIFEVRSDAGSTQPPAPSSGSMVVDEKEVQPVTCTLAHSDGVLTTTVGLPAPDNTLNGVGDTTAQVATPEVTAASTAPAPPGAAEPCPTPAPAPTWLTDAPPCVMTPHAHQTRVLFLGTGSAEPSKYRGPSAILLMLPDHQGSIMMDCGEGTWGALQRCLGYRAARDQAARLRCVWISHRHADHCLGLTGLLAARPHNATPLLVSGPHELRAWLQHLDTKHGYKTCYVHCRQFSSGTILSSTGMGGSGPAEQQHQQQMALGCGRGGAGLVQWCSVPVHHCNDAYGLVLCHRDGWKIVYSGDTRPCPALYRMGHGATLLIHEATFEPALQHQALSKRHSTSQEALQAAEQMQSYRTILTHFSQRYPRVPAGLGLTMDSDDDDEGRMDKEQGDGCEGVAEPADDQCCGMVTEEPSCSVAGYVQKGEPDLQESAEASMMGKELVEGCDGRVDDVVDGKVTARPVRSAAGSKHTIAFDGMIVTLAALPWLPGLVNPYLDSVLSMGKDMA